MFIIIIGVILILILLVLIFRDSFALRDLKLGFQKRIKPPSRQPINLRKSPEKYLYESNENGILNFSQPRDGRLTQYDFNLPLLPHRTSTYYNSVAFSSDKRLIKNKLGLSPSNESLEDSSFVKHRRAYYENNLKQQQQNIRNQKQSKYLSNQDVYKSASKFHENRLSTSFHQIYSSAENPYVLPSIVKKKVKVEEKPVVSAPTTSSANSSLFNLPPPPPSSKPSDTKASDSSSNAPSAPKFTFNLKK